MILSDILKDVKSVGITGHIRPDGDCTGSVLALYNYILENMPETDVDLYLEQPGSEFYYLKNIDKIKNRPHCYGRLLLCVKIYSLTPSSIRLN